MGLYNFMPQFVPKIRSGEKRHTIRGDRRYPDKPGDMMHLYCGLRTRSVELIMRVPCVRVERIKIDCTPGGEPTNIAIEGVWLSRSEREALARCDGFDSFADMMKFWNGRLPFHGHIYHWKFEPSAERKVAA
jgi:hypothetical protein